MGVYDKIKEENQPQQGTNRVGIEKGTVVKACLIACEDQEGTDYVREDSLTISRFHRSIDKLLLMPGARRN